MFSVRKELVAAHQQRAEGDGILCVLRPCSQAKQAAQKQRQQHAAALMHPLAPFRTGRITITFYK